MVCVPFSMIFRQCIYTISTSLTHLPVFPNVLQFCWVSISSCTVLKMLPFIHQISYLFSYLMHSYCGWKKKSTTAYKKNLKTISSVDSNFRQVGWNWYQKNTMIYSLLWYNFIYMLFYLIQHNYAIATQSYNILYVHETGMNEKAEGKTTTQKRKSNLLLKQRTASQQIKISQFCHRLTILPQ